MYESKHKRDCCELQNYWERFENCFSSWCFKANCLQMVKKVQNIEARWLQMERYKEKVYKTKNHPFQDFFTGLFENNGFKKSFSFWVKENKGHAWEFFFRQNYSQAAGKKI